MSSASRPPEPPVYAYRDWKRLVRAFTAAHRELAGMAQAEIVVALVSPVAHALWLLQERPDLCQKSELCLLIAQGRDLEGVDQGRWFQFIPWLLGRPELSVSVTLVMQACEREDPRQALEQEPEARALTARPTSGAQRLAKRAPARLFDGTLPKLMATHPVAPDVVTVCSPLLTLSLATLLPDSALPALVGAGAEVAVISTSEADSAVVQWLLGKAGFQFSEDHGWPNPWAVPCSKAQHLGHYAHTLTRIEGWQPRDETSERRVLRVRNFSRHIIDAIETCMSDVVEKGLDVLFDYGEPLHSHDGVLYRLPKGGAVDAVTGEIFMVNGAQAVPADDIGALAPSVLAQYPGSEHALERAWWAVDAYRALVKQRETAESAELACTDSEERCAA